MKILFVIPNIIAVETIEEPPRLRRGNGKPVRGSNPVIVEIFTIIWKANKVMKPVMTNLSKSELDIRKIWVNLKKNTNHRNKSNKTPIKPKL